jgi:lactate dehydrogenase-like 2-hydroxyacid dehydrogenase
LAEPVDVRRCAPAVWPELARKLVRIFGYGRIGQSIARRARGSDTEVCAIRRDVEQSAEDDLTLLGIPNIIDEVLRRSNYVVISMPATTETIGWIGRSKLGLMKPNAFLINIARAKSVDDDPTHFRLD